jgi:alpha-tubulin suppressor-like RCC1 family protein
MLIMYREIIRSIVAISILFASLAGMVHGKESLTISSIAAGSSHTCAVISDGTIRCWGNNHYGQMGNGMITEEMGVVVQVSGIKSAQRYCHGSRIHLCKFNRWDSALLGRK